MTGYFHKETSHRAGTALDCSSTTRTPSAVTGLPFRRTLAPMLTPSAHLLHWPFSRTSTRNLRTLCPSWMGSASRMTSNAAGFGNFNTTQGC